MKRRYVLMFLGLAFVASLMAAAVARADDIPGVPIPASPVQGYLDNSNLSGLDMRDVYSLPAQRGDRLHFVLNGQSGTADHYHVEVLPPGSMGVDGTTPIANTWGNNSYPKTLGCTAVSSGVYYVVVYIDHPDTDVAGAYSLAWSCMSPTMTVLTTHGRTVSSGSRVVVSGALKYTANGTGIANALVLLQGSANGTSWSKVSTETTNATGGFTFKVKATRSRYYHAVFAGTSSLIASKSISIHIKTKR